MVQATHEPASPPRLSVVDGGEEEVWRLASSSRNGMSWTPTEKRGRRREGSLERRSATESGMFERIEMS